MTNDSVSRCGRMVALAVMCILFLSACGGCVSQPAAPKAGTKPPEGEVLPIDERVTLSDGVRDLRNQYAFAVMVNASMKTGETLKCTGVLVSPQVVLTAGHCVCARHPSASLEDGSRFIIDNSACAEDADITALTYHPQEQDPKSLAGIEAETYHGKVSPHPSMRILLDAQSAVVSSQADLAAVILEEPVEDMPLPIAPAATGLKVGEAVLIAGYGFDVASDLIHGVRRSGQKKITKTPEGGGDQVLLEAYGGEFTVGGGEPCMVRKEKGVSLVGISRWGAGAVPAFTSIYPHRDWLEAEVQKARLAKAAGNNTLEEK